MKIVAFGDSITAGNPGFLSQAEAPPEGYGDVCSQYAYWIRQRHPEWKIYNRGISGQKTDQMLARFQEDVFRHKPDAVIILGGINDLVQGIMPESIQKNLMAMYAQARLAAIDTVACTLLPITGATPRFQRAIQEVNAWIEQTSAALGLGFCDLHKVMEDPQQTGSLRLSEDGVHPNVEGYRLIGETLSSVLESRLKEAKT